MAEYGGCRACRHFSDVYINYIPTCRAFPEGISPIIIRGTIEHTKPLPDKKNTIVYEPVEAAKQAVPQDQLGAGIKIMLNVKNPKVYDSVEKFVAHVNNYGRGTALQEPELTVRYAEYLKSQGYDAISTTTERMQHDLVFDPKQVVVVED